MSHPGWLTALAHQSVVRVNPAVGGALGGAVGWVPASQHAAVVTLLAHAATTAAPGIAAVVAILIERQRGQTERARGQMRVKTVQPGKNTLRFVCQSFPLTHSVCLYTVESSDLLNICVNGTPGFQNNPVSTLSWFLGLCALFSMFVKIFTSVCIHM